VKFGDLAYKACNDFPTFMIITDVRAKNPAEKKSDKDYSSFARAFYFFVYSDVLINLINTEIVKNNVMPFINTNV